MASPQDGEDATFRAQPLEVGCDVGVPFVDEDFTSTGREPLEFIHHGGQQVGVLKQFVDVEVFVFVLIGQERGQQSPFLSELHSLPGSTEGGLNVAVDQFNLTTGLVGGFHRRQQFGTGLLSFVDAQLALLCREHGLHQNHRGLAFFDDLEQALFVEAAVADERIMAAFAELNGHHVRLVGRDVMANRFNRSRGDVGRAQQSEVAVDVDDG